MKISLSYTFVRYCVTVASNYQSICYFLNLLMLCSFECHKIMKHFQRESNVMSSNLNYFTGLKLFARINCHNKCPEKYT